MNRTDGNDQRRSFFQSGADNQIYLNNERSPVSNEDQNEWRLSYDQNRGLPVNGPQSISHIDQRNFALNEPRVFPVNESRVFPLNEPRIFPLNEPQTFARTDQHPFSRSGPQDIPLNEPQIFPLGGPRGIPQRETQAFSRSDQQPYPRNEQRTCPLEKKQTVPNNEKPPCPFERKPVCPNKEKPPCPFERKPVCPNKEKPPCPFERKPVCPSNEKPPCPFERKPVCPNKETSPCSLEGKQICSSNETSPCSLEGKQICPNNEKPPCPFERKQTLPCDEKPHNPCDQKRTCPVRCFRCKKIDELDICPDACDEFYRRKCDTGCGESRTSKSCRPCVSVKSNCGNGGKSNEDVSFPATCLIRLCPSCRNLEYKMKRKWGSLTIDYCDPKTSLTRTEPLNRLSTRKNPVCSPCKLSNSSPIIDGRCSAERDDQEPCRSPLRVSRKACRFSKVHTRSRCLPQPLTCCDSIISSPCDGFPKQVPRLKAESCADSLCDAPCRPRWVSNPCQRAPCPPTKCPRYSKPSSCELNRKASIMEQNTSLAPCRPLACSDESYLVPEVNTGRELTCCPDDVTFTKCERISSSFNRSWRLSECSSLPSKIFFVIKHTVVLISAFIAITMSQSLNNLSLVAVILAIVTLLYFFLAKQF